MVKNINDLLSAVVLILLASASIRLFVWAFIHKEDDSADANKWQLIKDYIDNEEE